MLSTAITAARAAGAFLKERFGQPQQVNENIGQDIKIQTDIDTQNLIYDVILKAFPDHKCVGEEGDAGNPNGPVEWIVDPLDGTVNFFAGIPHFCTSIAARDTGSEGMRVGVIYDPMRDELFVVEAGKGAQMNGKKIAISPRDRLSDGMLALGFSKTPGAMRHCLEMYEHYGPRCKKLRAMGSAALDLAYVASGRLDAYIERGVSLWDVAAGWLLLEEAGGLFEYEIIENGKYHIRAHSGRLDLPMW